MVCQRFVLFFLISFLGGLSLAQPRDLKNTLQQFTALMKPHKLACSFDDSDDDDREDKYFAKSPFYSCEYPKLIKQLCTSPGYGDPSPAQLLFEADCRICDLPVRIMGKVGVHYQSSIQDNAGNTITEGYDYVAWPDYLSHVQSKTSLESIKKACERLNSPLISQAQDLSHLLGVQTLPEVNQKIPVGFPVLPKQGDDIEDGALIKHELKPGEMRVCDNDTDAESEVLEHLPNLEKLQMSPTKALGENPSYKFWASTRNEDKSSLKIEGLPDLVGVWSYESAKADLIEEKINHALFLKNKKELSVHLNKNDLDRLVHHMVFEKSTTAIDKENLKKVINKYLKLSPSYRIINPDCIPDKEEFLNITAKTADGEMVTQRYKFTCGFEGSKKVISELISVK